MILCIQMLRDTRCGQMRSCPRSGNCWQCRNASANGRDGGLWIPIVAQYKSGVAVVGDRGSVFRLLELLRDRQSLVDTDGLSIRGVTVEFPKMKIVGVGWPAPARGAIEPPCHRADAGSQDAIDQHDFAVRISRRRNP